jgi:uncharacterized protein YndB with AHSA1/START domain
MSVESFTVVLQLDALPAVVFRAIADPRRWWSEQIVGDTDRLGGSFVFEVPGIHFTRFTITRFEPDSLVVWHADEARLTFVADQGEWTGTEVRFELTPRDGGTELRFIHVGLVPDFECYEACSTAWSSYLSGSLARLAETGLGDPNQERPSGALEEAAEAARRSAS